MKYESSRCFDFQIVTRPVEARVLPALDFCWCCKRVPERCRCRKTFEVYQCGKATADADIRGGNIETHKTIESAIESLNKPPAAKAVTRWVGIGSSWMDTVSEGNEFRCIASHDNNCLVGCVNDREYLEAIGWRESTAEPQTASDVKGVLR